MSRRRSLLGCLLSTTFVFALIASSSPAAHAMDQVRIETKTDLAVTNYGVTGKGVVIAILDRGIDYTHPDFRNADGTTRIKWILDQKGQNLCPGSPAAVEYSEAQINASLTSGTPLGTRDAVGHGTVTTGLAAGNGRAFASGKYKGIAPEADLIIVKVTSEGALAHDAQPAEASFQGCIDEALTWLDSKLTLLGKPVVALINSGVQWGPIDGTSAVSRKLDAVFGENRPGRVYVGAPGDEGSYSNHAGGTYTNSAATIVRLNKSTADTTYMQMWYTGSAPAQVTVTFDDGTVVGPVAAGGFLDQSGVYIIQYNPGTEFYPWTSTSGDRAVWIRIIGHQTGGSVRIQGTPGSGSFNVYGDPNGIVQFTDHLVTGRLTDYAASKCAVNGACYVMRNNWTDIDGIARSQTGEGTTGQRWTGSSSGPTRDGRSYGNDITAPGQNIFGSYARNSAWATSRFNLVQDGGGWYGRAGATSGSAPLLVGAVALMLQRNPNLTATQVRNFLHSTGRSDANTGTTPNVNWGWGKLDVNAAVGAVPQPAGTVPDGKTAPGTPLTVKKATGTQLRLDWGASCNSVDSDYEVYEGQVGSFASHVPKLCTTGGLRSATITPGSANRYYLVVSRTVDREGSYGVNGAGVQRAISASACVPQDVRRCP